VHFTYAEASANWGKGFTGGAAEKENMKRALWGAEALRHQLGDHPLRVTSGYSRDEQHRARPVVQRSRRGLRPGG
jgi:hypothetical protein